MGGGKNKAPKTPDYMGVAQQEGKNNMALANYLTSANRANQYTPYGSSTWNYDNSNVQNAYNQQLQALQAQLASAGKKQRGGIQNQINAMQSQGVDAWGQANNMNGVWNQTTTLSPEQQAILNQQNANQLKQQQLGTNALNQMQTGAFNPTLDPYKQAQAYQQSNTGLPGNTLSQFQNLSEDTNSYYDQAAKALYDKQTQFMGDQFNKDEAAQRQRLASMGLQEGSEAYNNALDQFQRNKNAAYQTASLDSILKGYDVGTQNLNNLLNTRASNVGLQQGVYNQNANNYNLDMQDRSNAAANSLALAQQAAAQRQQQFNEQLTQRQLPLNEYAAMINGSGVTNPQFQGYNQASSYQTPDLLGATQAGYSANMAKYNTQQQQKGGLLGAGSGLLGMYLGGK